MIFSDLLDEQICNSADEGVLGKVEVRGSFGAKIFRAEIRSQAQAERFGKAQGRYSTLNISPVIHTYHKARRYAGKCLSSEISQYLGTLNLSRPSVLVVGLGNAFVIADSLGAEVVKNLLPTHSLPAKLRGELGDLACLIPGVSGLNGIATHEIVASAVGVIRPQIVILVDTLTAKNYERLGCSFQISDTSITPGAGVGSKNRPLDKTSLGTNVLTIGVPLMISARNFSELADLPDLVLTPKEIDFFTKNCAQIIANAINLAVHGKNYLKFM